MNMSHRYNVRGDKTHVVGDGSHTTFLPAANALLSPSGILGLCMLYRFCSTTHHERFPTVCNENGRYYKWLPLVIETEGSYKLDTKKALLSIRGVTDKAQNKVWNMLYSAAGVEMYLGDALTHAGRAAAQQEAEDAGVGVDIVNRAIGYHVKNAKEEHYTPHIPLAFQLQRGFYSHLAEDVADADAPHLLVMRTHADDVREIVDDVLPELPEQEAIVAAISSQPVEQCEKAVRQQKRANSESHKREHENFLGARLRSNFPPCGGMWWRVLMWWHVVVRLAQVSSACAYRRPSSLPLLARVYGMALSPTTRNLSSPSTARRPFTPLSASARPISGSSTTPSSR